MLKDLYVKPTTYKAVEIAPEYFALDSVDTVEDGIVLKRSVVKPRSVAKDFKGFSIQDFAITTIIATGSEKLLRPVQFRNADVESTASAMLNVVKMFEDEKAS